MHRESLKKQNSRIKRLKEELILSKATELFRQKGYSSTSMSDIGSAVGLLKQSLYNYFRSKEEILFKIVYPAMSDVVNMMEELVRSDIAPKEKLRSAIDGHFKILDKYLNIYVLSREDINSIGGDFREEISKMRYRYHHLVSEIIAQGINAGQVRRDLPPKVMNYTIIGIFSWMSRTYTKMEPLTASELADYYYSLITKGLMVSNEQTQ